MMDVDYYVGYDIGSDSVGMAVTDTDYNLLKYKGRTMWFTRLFDESITAEERRSFRSGMRRVKRRRERINLLQMFFNEPIAKVDPAFFQRLSESNLYEEDKTVGVPYAVFADENYTDKDFHNEFPTVYHLRKELIQNPSKHDVRLVYLALHHLIKHRGHFLFDTAYTSEMNSFGTIFNDLKYFLYNEYEIELNCEDTEKLSNILKERKLGKNQKYNEALKVCKVNKKQERQAAAVLSLLCGKTEKASALFDDDTLEEGDVKSIQLSGDYDKNSADYIKAFGDKIELIEQLKAVYDWSVLADVLDGEKYISYAKVKSFNKHKADLKKLKGYVKKYCPQKYNEIFKESKSGLNNYTAYCGKIKTNGKTGVLNQSCELEAFCAYLKKVLKNTAKEGYEDMFAEIEAGTFMPKQHIKDNGVIPMQLNLAELEAILKNACGYLDFLNYTNQDGKTVADKIIDIFKFRIPYYVGALNKHSGRAWLERKDGKIYPWNFNDIVDVDLSAENFIKNLTSKCTYLPDKDVIAKNTVLYSKFTVLNELNNLRINGEKISVQLKKDIYNDLFLKRKKVTKKAVLNHLKAQGLSDVELTGIDNDFKSGMKSYLDLCEYNLSQEEMDRIITAITIFGDDRHLLRKRLKNEFKDKLSEDDINKISHLKYSGWGKLSREFLCDIYGVNPQTGELLNIINALWETNDNLMILLGSKYNFAENLKKALTVDTEKSLKEMVDGLYVSPKVKRPIIQSLKMMEEVVKVMGQTPKKIFVEMTRYDGEKGAVKKSRKDLLIDLYKKCGEVSGDLYDKLQNTDNERLRQDKLYLYYTQLGKCMYTGEPINLDALFDSNVYDIDHIYPRSKVKDDSLSNRVLVKKEQNANKDNDYPLSPAIRGRMYSYWKMLVDKELITKEKFKRLIRTDNLTDDELSDFIARQLVETSQSSKAVAQILSQIYPEADIVYVKAGNVSQFRQKYDLLKCRAVNDLHHAKDAYLNIVVGNVYDVRCTKNKINFIKGLQSKKYSLNKMFNYNVEGAWKADNDESINTVKKTMSKNNVIYTRYSFCKHGSLFKIQPLKKGYGQVPLVKDSARRDISKYGGYDKATSTYFVLVEHIEKKGEKVISMLPINLYQQKEFEQNPTEFLTDNYNLNSPKILLNKVKYNTCISVDGFRMHISSKTGSQITYKPAMQLVVSYQDEKYIRNISKYLEKYSYRDINASDGLTAEENTRLFDIITDKMTNTILKIKFSDTGEKIKDKRQKFIELNVERQCYVLNQMLNIIHANVMTGDLTDIGLAANTGKVRTAMNYSSIKGTVKIINQSVTGLFESYYVIK